MTAFLRYAALLTVSWLIAVPFQAQSDSEAPATELLFVSVADNSADSPLAATSLIERVNRPPPRRSTD